MDNRHFGGPRPLPGCRPSFGDLEFSAAEINELLKRLVKMQDVEGLVSGVNIVNIENHELLQPGNLTLEDLGAARLANMNDVFVPWQGSAYATRNYLPALLRRKGISISYVTDKGIAVKERAVSDVGIDNANWGIDSNWMRVDELSLNGELRVSPNGTWVINGVDTGIQALGPKGDNGLTPRLKTIDNKLHYSYDGNTWLDAGGEHIAAWFRWSGNKIQISRDNKTWEDFSGEFADNLFIKGYVATFDKLPADAVQGDIWGVGPRYAAEDTEQTQPIYRYWVRNADGWVDNGEFTSIKAGIVQETGDGEGVVMSQKAVSGKLAELESEEISNSLANKKTNIELSLTSGGFWDGKELVENSTSVYSEKIDISALNISAVVFAIKAVDVVNSGRGMYLSDSDDNLIFGVREDQPTLVEDGIAYYLLDTYGKNAYYLRFSSRASNTLIFCHAYKGNVENDIIGLKEDVIGLKEDVIGLENKVNGTFEVFPSLQGDYEPLTGNINTSTGRMRYLSTDKKGIITMGDEFTFAPYGNDTGSGACTLLTEGYVTEYNSNLNPYAYTILRIKRKDEATPLLQADVKISYGDGLVGAAEAEVACYVDAEIGNDNNDGKKDSPLKTINAALIKGKKKIMIAANTYNERIYLKNVNDISICCYTPTFVLGENKDRAIINAGGNGYAVWIENCANIVLEGIEAYNSHSHCVYINLSNNVTLRSCIAHKNIAVDNASGFKTRDSFVQFFNCEAYDVKLDGFGLSGYGTQDLYNCKAHDCADDGVSHHDACKGVIVGGEFYNCGKGGVSSPCHGSSVDIQGVYSHDNKYGLYALSDRTKGKSVISNSCFVNNSAYDIIQGGQAGVDIVLFNSIYKTKYISYEEMVEEIS